MTVILHVCLFIFNQTFFTCLLAEQLPSSFDLDSINLPDYVHVPIEFTLNTEKFSESADMTVSMTFAADEPVADRLNLPQNYLDEIELCWIKITEDEVIEATISNEVNIVYTELCCIYQISYDHSYLLVGSVTINSVRYTFGT